ncbi:MAG: hypothetical protein JKY92_06660 [Magnetovibrio sp.]|nr:hypothetical protein [Magnetovibrio sp.]
MSEHMPPTPPPSPPLPALSPESIIRDELEKTASLITASQDLMADGRTVDLSAVEDRVRVITQTLSKAPPEIAASFKEHLTALLEILDTLEVDIEQQQQLLDDNLDSLKRRAARTAYGTPKPPPAPVVAPKTNDDGNDPDDGEA